MNGSSRISLTVLLATGFVVLGTLPLLGLLALNHNRLEAANIQSLQRQLSVADKQSLATVAELQDGAMHVMPTVASTVAADLERFKGPAVDEVLFAAVEAVDAIDALYVSFSDGTHRVVTRVDADRRKTDARIPSEARWHSSWVDSFEAGPARARHRSYYSTWGSPVEARWDEPSDFDPRTLSHFQRARETGAPAMVEPSINPDTGMPVVSIAVPILVNGEFVGIVGGNLTFRHLSAHLAQHRVSAHGLTLLLDQQGHIVAHPNSLMAFQAASSGEVWPARSILGSAELEGAAMEVVEARYASLETPSTPVVRAVGGEVYHLLATPFEPVGSTPWMVLTVVPESDFVGETRRALRWLAGVILSVTALQLVLIMMFARRVGSRIEAMGRRFRSIRRLRFEDQVASTDRRVWVRELSELESGFQLLVRSLRGFARFVPRGVVAPLITSDENIRTGVQQRELSLFFCDLQGFTALAEQSKPEDLLRQVSEYFEVVTASVTEEGGTIDKFIGDAVMAFWGAPEPVEDPTLRAARAALRVRHRFASLSARWEREGLAPLHLRIGVHHASVLVGTIGTKARLTYTALGDGVNVAARLEGANKELGTSICVSEAIRSSAPELVCRPLRRLTVKGRSEPLLVHELLGIHGTAEPGLQASVEAEGRMACGRRVVSAMDDGNTERALELLRAHLNEDPQDAAARALQAVLERSRNG